MINLERYLKKEDNEMLLSIYRHSIDDYDKWLFETYDETNDISEDEFYMKKFNLDVFDMPQYWFWQDHLYETLNTSVTVDSSVFAKLFNKVKGITKSYVQTPWSIGFEYNEDFSEQSTEFEQLLDFGNYFIKSKRDKNYKLPNPFFIEARRPKELQEYRFTKAWHVTNKYAYEKIKKQGLIPKSKSNLANYEYRIYLFVDDSISKYELYGFGSINNRLYNLSTINNSKHSIGKLTNDDIVILEIDLEKFERDHKKQIKLFGDPNFNKMSAVFTLEPIPTKYIKIAEIK